MNATKLFRKMNVYTLMFAMFAGVIATLLGIASILLMLDMLGLSVPIVADMLGLPLP